MNMNEGGITQVQTEQKGKIRIGTELERLTDEAFANNRLDIQPE
jgi:hypothetical protein